MRKVSKIQLKRIGGNRFRVITANIQEQDTNIQNNTLRNDVTSKQKKVKGCFNNLIYTKVWRHRGEHDILHVLKHYKERIKKSIFLHLHRDESIKFYITLKVQL